jgi:5,10-methylenetetrahydrofolate reductase
MRIDEILDDTRPCFSFEFFPPKTDEGMENLWRAANELKQDDPAFVSVTYGAGGSTRERTIDIVKRIKNELGLEAMAHFTCVGATVEQLREQQARTTALLQRRIELAAQNVQFLQALLQVQPESYGGRVAVRGHTRSLVLDGRA